MLISFFACLFSTNYGPLDSTHLTNGSGVWSQESPLKHHGSSPYESLLNASGSHLHHTNDHLNDDNENIIVDDDEEEEGVTKDKAGDPFFYTTDSSNSTNTSDSSSYNSDNSNGDKDEVVVVTTAAAASELGDAQLQPQQPSAESISSTEKTVDNGASTTEQFSHELTHKKRPSPTPPAELSQQCIENIEEKDDDDALKDDVEPPLTPKKLRVQQDDDKDQLIQETLKLVEKTQEPVVELEATPSKVADVEVAVEANEQEQVMTQTSEESSPVVPISPSTSSIEEIAVTEQLSAAIVVVPNQQQQPLTDDSMPMELNMLEDVTNGTVANVMLLDQLQAQPQSQNGGFSKGDDIAMQTGVQEESLPDDQVMDEPMDQE